MPGSRHTPPNSALDSVATRRSRRSAAAQDTIVVDLLPINQRMHVLMWRDTVPQALPHELDSVIPLVAVHPFHDTCW
jgi:hypothetical protein